jgi:hypothetical protein
MLHAAHDIQDPAPPKEGVHAWTQERIDLLIQLRSDKLSRAAIADEINLRTGSIFTRSAVSGKIDRIFPAAKPKKTPEELAETRRQQRLREAEKKRQRRLTEKVPAGFASPAPAPKLEVVIPRPEEFPDARIHGLAALETYHCRFICNDDMSAPVYCGLPVIDKTSWCSGHHAQVFTPRIRKAA